MLGHGQRQSLVFNFLISIARGRRSRGLQLVKGTPHSLTLRVGKE